MHRWRAFVLWLSLGGAVAQAADPVVEFYNAGLDHYFLTISPEEAAGIDAGAAGPGWHRTARVFGAYPAAADAPPDALPVCRFYGNVAAGGPNSHFYTADPAECAAVKDDPGWSYEGIAFLARVPIAGSCPVGTVAILRNYNQRFAARDSNHRYGADPALYDEMAAIGWAREGVVMCGEASIATPPRGSPVVASGLSNLAPNCERVNAPGTFFPSAEVEPYIAINPRAPDHFIGVWQQDRWDNGGARGLVTGVSFDGGRSWRKAAAPFSRCTGGTAASGGDYTRASDPWVTFSPDGVAYQIGIAFRGAIQQPGGVGNVAVSRSHDGGLTWEAPIVLREDVDEIFNDKEAITADPTDARYAYAIWDRIDASQVAQTWLARTTDAGESWEPARMIYDPGSSRSTLNNQIVVLPDGTLINFFTEFEIVRGDVVSESLSILRSTDKGLTWSARIPITRVMSVGTHDPDTVQRVRDASAFGHIAVDRQGRLVVVWQDARTSGGMVDAVLASRSLDGGFTWSAPVRVNADPTVAAFVPAVAIARDGTIGVTYYDFRLNTADPATLPTTYWLARSSDGINWSETQVDGPFDLLDAPVAGGRLFLGDYAGLATVGNAFVPFYARSNPDAPGNRSDIVVRVIEP